MDIDKYIDSIRRVLKRRWWLAVILFSTILVASLGLGLSLPYIYTSSASILIEGQSIPEDYVRSTVTMDVERRLQVLTQKILSRQNLEKLMTQFGLYEDLRNQGVPESALLTAIQSDIGIQIEEKRRNREMAVAFGVSYTSPDPHKAVTVANALASFYIETNIQVREQQALGTAEFLQEELEEIQKRLESQESQVAEYKNRNMGELPEQLSANLNTLTMLQTQLQATSESLARAHDRKRQSMFFGQLSGLRGMPTDGTTVVEQLGGPGQKLEQMKVRLAEKRLRLTKNHPEILQLEKNIASLERQLKNQLQAGPSAYQNTERAASEAEITRLNDELNRIQSDIVKYQQRIENIPSREQELLSLNRNYQSTHTLYTSLLQRLEEAKLADSLEHNQKAERFRLLEPAVFPDEPVGPKRKLLLLLGCMLGIGIATAGVVLAELIQPTFHSIEDLKAFTIVPILGSVPTMLATIEQEQDTRRQNMAATALAVGLILLLGTSYWLGQGNEQLAQAFTLSGGS